MIRHVLKLVWHRKRANLLLTVEIFFSFLVLFAVVALGVYMGDNWRRPVGFGTEDVWVIGVDAPSSDASTNMSRTGPAALQPQQPADDSGERAARIELTRQLFAALKDLPQVERVSGAHLSPYEMGGSTRSHDWNGRHVEFSLNTVGDEFKDVLGLEVVRGRWFSPDDAAANYDAVVINQAMADTFFPGEDPIGKDLRPPDPRAQEAPGANDARRVQRVVGVVRAYREDGEIDGMVSQALYREDYFHPESGGPPNQLLVRVRPGTTAAFEETVLRTLQPIARDWSFEVKPLAEKRAGMLRFAFTPVLAIGLVAAFLMLMVALGLTGVLWQSVTQRTREIGLRRAKGAERARVQRQILGELSVMSGFALLLGAVVVLQLPLMNVIPWVEPHVYMLGLAISASAIYLLTVLCGWYPSRLATRVEPAEALRYE